MGWRSNLAYTQYYLNRTNGEQNKVLNNNNNNGKFQITYIFFNLEEIIAQEFNQSNNETISTMNKPQFSFNIPQKFTTPPPVFTQQSIKNSLQPNPVNLLQQQQGIANTPGCFFIPIAGNFNIGIYCIKLLS